jgi:hypothetical protein
MAGGRMQTIKQVFSDDLRVSAGWEPQLQSIHKYGANAAVGASLEDVWSKGGLYTGWLTATDTVRIKAGGDAADDAGGLGVRTVVVSGLNSGFQPATAILTTNGADASASSTQKFIRVNRCWAVECGTYTAANTGAIEIETTGGTTVAHIAAEAGQTLMAMFTIPHGWTGWIREWHVIVEGGQPSTITMWQRQNADNVTAPFTSKRVLYALEQAEGLVDLDFPKYLGPLPERTDVWVSAVGTASNPGIASSFDLLLVDNTL